MKQHIDGRDQVVACRRHKRSVAYVGCKEPIPIGCMCRIQSVDRIENQVAPVDAGCTDSLPEINPVSSTNPYLENSLRLTDSRMVFIEEARQASCQGAVEPAVNTRRQP